MFTREEKPLLTENYKTHNKIKTPILIFFDGEFNEKARWIERPKAAQQMVNGLSRELREKLKESNKTGKELEDLEEDLRNNNKKIMLEKYLSFSFTNLVIEEIITIFKRLGN